MLLAHDVAGEGPDVVLLHAAIGDRRLWDLQWPWLTAGHRTIRCDLRGYGGTPVPDEAYRSATDVLDLLDHIGVARAVLVAGSLGGRVALELAVARPAVIASMVLISPSLPGHGWSEEVRAFGDAEDEALCRGDIDAAVELNLVMWVDGHGRSAAVDGARRCAVGAMQRRAFELQLAARDGAVEELLVPDLVDRAAGITAPTLIVVGEHDAPDFHAIGARLAAELPHARLRVLPGTAHVPYFEQPELFDPVLRDALETAPT